MTNENIIVLKLTTENPFANYPNYRFNFKNEKEFVDFIIDGLKPEYDDIGYKIEILSRNLKKEQNAKASIFAWEQVNSIVGDTANMEIQEFEDFFKEHKHLGKEIGYSLGMIQAYLEINNVDSSELGETLQNIVEIMQSTFDKI